MRRRAVVWMVTIAALVYSAAHFVQSGVRFPLSQPNLGKFEEETPPLREHMRTGEPVHLDNRVQYGPVFFFVVQPLMKSANSERQFANRLYTIQIVCIVLGLLATCATLRPLVAPRDWPLAVAWLVVLWTNFTPLYTTLVVKSVETWELCLLVVALYFYVRRSYWPMGFALSAAVLIKVLPLLFFPYLLVTNRPAFFRACAALLVLLLISHAIYGPQMGLGYLPYVARAATGESFGITWHENVSIKAAVAKMFGHLKPRTATNLGEFSITLTATQLRAATIIGDTLVLFGLAGLVWAWFRRTTRSVDVVLWEWSFATIAMLMLSPNTTFEYATLGLGAISYALVRVVRGDGVSVGTTAALAGAMFFLGVLLPRQLLNRLTFVETLSRWSGYSQLTPSEAYQYYCFPLVGLLLLVVALWGMRPHHAEPTPARV